MARIRLGEILILCFLCSFKCKIRLHKLNMYVCMHGKLLFGHWSWSSGIGRILRTVRLGLPHMWTFFRELSSFFQSQLSAIILLITSLPYFRLCWIGHKVVRSQFVFSSWWNRPFYYRYNIEIRCSVKLPICSAATWLRALLYELVPKNVKIFKLDNINSNYSDLLPRTNLKAVCITERFVFS